MNELSTSIGEHATPGLLEYAVLGLFFAALFAVTVAIIVGVVRVLLTNIGNIARFIGRFTLGCLKGIAIIWGLAFLIACPPLILLLILFKD